MRVRCTHSFTMSRVINWFVICRVQAWPTPILRGAMRLFHKRLRSRLIEACSFDNGWLSPFWSQMWQFFTSYQPLNSHLLDMLMLLSPNTLGACTIGDHNDEPHEHPNAGGRGLRRVVWPDTQKWANSCAAAAAVASGSSFSSGTWTKVVNRPEGACDRCIWHCGRLGSLHHVRWQCPLRPVKLSCPRNPLVARFGWRVQGADCRNLRKVREWLVETQLALWKHNHPGRPPDAL